MKIYWMRSGVAIIDLERRFDEVRRRLWVGGALLCVGGEGGGECGLDELVAGLFDVFFCVLDHRQ